MAVATDERSATPLSLGACPACGGDARGTPAGACAACQADAAAAPHDGGARLALGRPCREETCADCGACWAFPDRDDPLECPGCGSRSWSADALPKARIRPGRMAAFEVTLPEAQTLLARRGRCATPQDEPASGGAPPPRAVLVPYWSFSVSARARRAGEPPVTVHHEALQVPASRALPGRLQRGLGAPGFSGAHDYRPENLPPAAVEAPCLPASVAWAAVAELVALDVVARFPGRALGASAPRGEAVVEFEAVATVLTLRPIWLQVRQTRLGRRRVAVDGLTGAVVGELGWDTARLGTLAGAALALGAWLARAWS